MIKDPAALIYWLPEEVVAYKSPGLTGGTLQVLGIIKAGSFYPLRITLAMKPRMWMLLLLCGPLGALGTEDALPGDVLQLQTLHCPPCDRIHCSSRRALKLQCKGGVTTGVCGCCPVCARTEGESCGGNWDYLGKCDEGLVCVYQEPAAEKPDAERKGICKAVVETLEPESCSPECTKEFCRANPSAVCSARFVSLEKKACQGSCQHTSCSSCLVLRRPASCPRGCAPSDPACLLRFGRCVHTHLRAHPACSSDLQNTSEGNLVCLVPDCLQPNPGL